MASAWSSRVSPASYSASAKLMHWFVAAAVIALLAIGPVMKRLVPEGRSGTIFIPSTRRWARLS